MQPIKIFIGHDHNEEVAYHVLCSSIIRHSSVPVCIIPLQLSNLKGIYTRPRDPKQSNEFSFTRFLVPYLCDYVGKAIFMDCDMLIRHDIKELLSLLEDDKAVAVVKHDYTSKVSEKYLGTKQYAYPRKNWSSVMVFNNSHSGCKKLTLKYVNNAPALDLHRFKWAEDNRIGELPKEWNHLVGEYNLNPDAKLVHFTVGGPYFDEYADCEYSEEWMKEAKYTLHCTQLGDIKDVG